MKFSLNHYVSPFFQAFSNFDQLDMGMVALEPNGFTMLHHMVVELPPLKAQQARETKSQENVLE
jgi:hypothetical protein